MNTKKINKILVANRGEIACRVIRTASELGLETVAIYSDADSNAQHVQAATQAVRVGPAPVAESYLALEAIVTAAKETGCDAVHPGYGFLSENTAFAAACESADIRFIGPSAYAVELMGDKARSKRAMIEADVPCIPGYQGEDQATDVLIKEAGELGFPLMIKAAAGGGGRGMRLVHSIDEVANAIETARSEALNAFGADELILERALLQPRHVEIQVFGDQHGNIVYLGERDCSVQRRHQKVIEEAPCPVMTESLRQAMGEAAVAAARAVDYVGAGTVEFLLDQDGSFYFLEMNTRLQVEHPVTELITGLDLVALQIRVAQGEALGFEQEDVTLTGHAIEVRLYAEDPANDFLPSTGKIEYWAEPAGTGTRLDSGVVAGDEVSPYYDPMLAKVIAWGNDRDEARRHLRRALSESLLVGPATNRDFLIDALGRSTFADGSATTAFIAEEYGDDGFSSQPDQNQLCYAALTQYIVRSKQALDDSLGVNDELLNWSSAVRLKGVSVYNLDEENCSVTVQPTSATSYLVQFEQDAPVSIDIVEVTDHSITFETATGRQRLGYYDHGDGTTLSIAFSTLEVTVQDIAAGKASEDAAGTGQVVSPMHGQLLELYVAVGDAVQEGQRIALLEAMKMQHEIFADVSGTVEEVHANVGAQLAIDAPIMNIAPVSESEGESD